LSLIPFIQPLQAFDQLTEHVQRVVRRPIQYQCNHFLLKFKYWLPCRKGFTVAITIITPTWFVTVITYVVVRAKLCHTDAPSDIRKLGNKILEQPHSLLKTSGSLWHPRAKN
tara:strand:- start:53146 stop:53481 length:336 start_codon:yes stop_codon:yes gene_type:complete